MFYLFAGTSPERHAEVLREFEREVARVQDAQVGADELRRCQVRLKAARRMARQTNGARALHAALNAVYGLPVDDDARYDAAIDAVTVDTLADFARRRLRRELRTQLVVKP
jgi:zinc protease